VTSLKNGGSYGLSFGKGDVNLDILRPVSAHQAYPGPHESTSGRFLMRLFVDGPEELKPDGAGERSVLGLRSEDFTVKVGDLEGAVLNAGYVGGEYWLVVKAPSQAADGEYDLTVELCDAAITAQAVDAVLYGEYALNHVLCLDVSGSMDNPSGSSKMEAAVAAAMLYVDALPDTDGIGVVSFSGDDKECNEDAETDGSGVGEANWLKRVLVKAYIGSLAAGGWTSISDGLWTSQSLLTAAPTVPDAETVNTILLLSDGMENETRLWGESDCGGDVELLLTGADTRVNAVALGPYTDQGLLQDMATATGGDYLYTDVTDSASGSGAGGGLPAGGGGGMSGLSLSNRLADAFMAGIEKARGLERLEFRSGVVAPGSPVDLTIEVSESDVTSPVVFIAWDDTTVDVEVEITDGDSVSIDSDSTIYDDDGHIVYHLNRGVKLGEVFNVAISSDGSTEYIVGLQGRPGKGVEILLVYSGARQLDPADAVRERFEQGVPVTVLAFVNSEDGPVLAADVDIDIELPDGSIASAAMLDDGSQGDAEPDDGIYGLRFTETAQASTTGQDTDTGGDPPPDRGSFIVSVTATGTLAGGEAFRRVKSSAFHVYERMQDDPDGDHVPTAWEVYYGTDPAGNDALADDDGDALSNSDEFGAGTDPMDPDTDGGGQADGSEVTRGRRPTHPADDAARAVVDVEVVAHTGCENELESLSPLANLLRFPVHEGMAAMKVFRSTSVLGPFAEIAEVDVTRLRVGNYHDTSLTDGVEYFYRFQAIGHDGDESALSRTVSGTARSDPYPPRGSVAINGGAARTDSLAVQLELRASTDAEWYRISASPLDGSEPLEAMTTSLEYELEPPDRIPGMSLVYVQYVDAAGNESEVIHEPIIYDPAGDFDADGTANAGDLDDDDDGVDDATEITVTGTDPYDSDSDADGDLDSADNCGQVANPEQEDLDADGIGDACDSDVDGDGVGNARDCDATDALIGPCPPPLLFLRGDCNGDGVSGGIGDPVFLLLYLFLGGTTPPCLAACDANGDGGVTLSDAVYSLVHSFVGGPAPPSPYPACGSGPEAASVLGCVTPSCA